MWRVSYLGYYCCDQKQLGEERVYFIHSSVLQFTKSNKDRNAHRAGTWRQELTQRPWRGAAYWPASQGFHQPTFLRNSGPPALG